MSGRIAARLAELGLEVPAVATPAGAYTGYVRSGDLVFVSGQIPKEASGLVTGKIGAAADIAHGQRAARVCALNLIAQLSAACEGDLDRLVRVVKLTGFVNAAPDFTEHPQVINGASQLFLDVFGAAGVHARAAVGSSSLPFDVSVEVEGVFQIR